MQTAWRLFWDQQLLKVLDVQFLRDLRTVFDSLPVQHVKLVYSDRQVALQPPLEDVRSAFYHSLLDPFLSLPSQVRFTLTQQFHLPYLTCITTMPRPAVPQCCELSQGC